MKVKHLLHCHLQLPLGQLRVLAADKSMPALKKLLAWSLSPVVTADGVEGWLCRQFGVARQHDWPTAPLAALGDGLDGGTGYWLHADPVYVHLLRDRIVLTDDTFADLTTAEAEAMTGTLNQYFSADELEFSAPRQNHWYLRLMDVANINTCSRENASGADIQQHLPSGPDSLRWRQRLNEAQMLLHEHPVNQAREQLGALPVNSLWLWGGGVLPQGLSSPFVEVSTDDALLMGLAKAAGCPASPQPASAGEWLAQSHLPGAHLIKLDVANNLENDWFKPLATALQNKQLESLTLHLAAPGQVQSFPILRTQCWKFWRRASPLILDTHD